MSALTFDGTPNHTPVGYFTYTLLDDRWTWSDGLYTLHGYAPQHVAATTELMLEHKHPDDVARTLDVLEDVMRTGDPFSCYHRIVDTQGRVRYVLSVGRGVLDAEGAVEEVTGFFVDLTQVRRDETQVEVEAALLKIAQTRLVIEQAKGIVMASAGCSPEDAFAILRRTSSRTNVKLNKLALDLVETLGSQSSAPGGAALEGLLGHLDLAAPDVRRQVTG